METATVMICSGLGLDCLGIYCLMTPMALILLLDFALNLTRRLIFIQRKGRFCEKSCLALIQSFSILMIYLYLIKPCYQLRGPDLKRLAKSMQVMPMSVSITTAVESYHSKPPFDETTVC
mmetsp:Transcript_15232/g.31006  ORF Transcript_15232/g.31006 Transcript_15232/m.31006 type:complete len:120 (+) Transcript_15232:996-1355(+)